MGSKNEEKRTHWIRWENRCEPKWEGGIGLRDLGSFNKALLATQGWRLIQKGDNLLARTLKVKYFPPDEFNNATLGHNPSCTWTSILEGGGVLELGLIWIVGDGCKEYYEITNELW